MPRPTLPPTTAPVASPAPLARGGNPAWWVALFGLALALRVFAIGDAWSPDNRDFHGIFGSYATGGPVTTLAQRGLFESGGMPVEWRVDLADGTTETRFYMHHPPAFMLISAVFVDWLGVRESVLRIPPLLFSLFSIFALYRLARYVADERIARFAALLMAIVPYSARDGMQCWTEGAIAGTTCLVLLHALRFMDGERKRDLWSAAGWLAVGALLDWPAHLVLVGLAVWGLVRCSREGRWSRMAWSLVLPAVSVALLLLHRVHMHLVVGAEGAAKDSAGALTNMLWPGTSAELLQFFGLQWAFQLQGFTAPVLVLALIGLVAAQGRRVEVRAAAIWLGLPSGFLYVLLFPKRSVNHDFFMLVSAPAVCLAAAAGAYVLVDLALRRRVRFARFATDALAIALVVWCTWRVVFVTVTHRSDEMRWLVRQEWLEPIIADERAVVITHLGRGACLPFYSTAPIVYGTGDVHELDAHLATIVDRVEPERRCVFFYDESFGRLDPKMAQVVARLLEVGSAQEHIADIGKGPERFYIVDLTSGGGL